MSPCKYCGAPIRWIQAETGWRPLEEDGSPHKCPQRRMTQRANAKARAGQPLTQFGGRTGPGADKIPPWPEGVLPWDDAP